jgi:hypothetical protein
MGEISIPGDPGALQSLAARLRQAAGDVESVRGRVAQNGLDGAWSGRASDAFRGTLHELPGELAPIATAFDGAAQSLAGFATRLAELQEQARWYEDQITGAHQELNEAHARNAAAETKLRAARLAHAAASDPVSLHTAQSAVNVGEAMVRQAGADIEDLGGNVTRLLSGAQSIRDAYDGAVRTCCSALDGARHSGGRSFANRVSGSVHRLLGHVDHAAATWWRFGERAERDAERDAEHFGAGALREFDRGWAPMRAVLMATSEALGEATLIVGGGTLVVAAALLVVPGVDVPAGLVVAADLEVMEDVDDVLEVESVAVLAGDAVASIDQPQYRRDLPGDGVRAIPGDRLFGPSERKISRLAESSPALRPVIRRASRSTDDAVEFAESEGKGALKLGEDFVQGKLSDLVDHAAHSINPLISAPLESPLPLKIGLPAAASRST